MIGRAVTDAARGVSRDLRDLAAAWDRFWLAPLAPDTLGILRIATGLMLLYSHAVWSLALDEFFTEGGWQPAEFVAASTRGAGWSYWWWVPDRLIWPVHWVSLAVLAAYAAGLLTRVTKWLAVVVVLSYAQRTPYANFGLDQISGMLALYLALGPCGARWSVDAWLGRTGAAASAPTAAARLATRLIQVHLCVIYLYAGLAKLKGTAWWNGEAIWMTLANEEYQSLDLTLLAWHPRLTEAMTHGTVAWELSFWALVWVRRLRLYVLAVGTLMHFGIGAFLGMWTFGIIMTIAYLAFVPPDAWRRLRSETV